MFRRPYKYNEICFCGHSGIIFQLRPALLTGDIILVDRNRKQKIANVPLSCLALKYP